jgi:hypothetical protein
VLGAKHTKSALDSLQVSYEHSTLAYNAIVGTCVMLVVLLVLMLALSCYRSVLELQRDTEGAAHLRVCVTLPQRCDDSIVQDAWTEAACT